MLKGEGKYGLKEFVKKEGVNYHNRNLKTGACFEQYDRQGNLIYYNCSFLLASNAVSNYKQEYAYNHIAHIVSYRDSDGVKWEKQYTPEGFDIVYKNKIFKVAFRFKHKTNKIIAIESNGHKDIIDISKCKSISIINGIDFSDRFLLENKSLFNYFISDLPATDLQEKIIAFKDDELSDKVLNYLKGIR